MAILVVDDEPAVRDSLRRALELEGYEVELASDGEEALGLLSGDREPEAVILDILMPGIDGLEVCRRLRKSGNTLPVLMLTARAEVDSRVAGLDAGADDYLRKPFAFPELVARVRALLRRGYPPAPRALRVEDLELDAVRFEVRRAGVRVPLTAKEFAILEYLMRHTGELVTRTMLLEQCWDRGYDGLSNLVDVFVSRLRRKLEGDGRSPLIHTIRGAGFILSGEPR